MTGKSSKNKIKIVVAMSGGVDSSVAAAVLKNQGFYVIGIFLKFWKPSLASTENICCSKEAAESARRVAEKLDIPFYVLDATKEFKKEVVDYYINEYDAGRTPNPCVMCNKFIKFGWLLQKTKELGAKFVATGHYARIFPKLKTKNEKLKTITKNLKLLKAKDKKKDQSYFLWKLSREQLRSILFPIGDYTKTTVRRLAKKFGLPTAEKKESQNVCFVPDGNNPKFLSKYIKKLSNSGNIVDLKANILGRHNGLAFYTIGQRRDLRIDSSAEPKYVIRLDVEKNVLIVGEEKDLYSTELIAKNLNFIYPLMAYDLQLTAKIRYGQKEARCKITNINSNHVKVAFQKLQRAITPGQSIVFYKGEELIGGGVIK